MSKFTETYAKYLKMIDKDILTNSEENELFEGAISNNCINMVRIILKLSNNQYQYINLLNKEGYPPLHLVIKKGYFELLQLLLTQPNLDINLLDNAGNNALHLAINMGSSDSKLPTIDSLIKANINLNIFNLKGETALSTTLMKILIDSQPNKEFNIKLAILLIESGAQLEQFAGDESILFKLLPVLNQYENLARTFFKYGINVNSYDKDNNSLLYIAVDKNYDELINILIEQAADINCINQLHNTPLHLAIQKKSYPIITKLLQNHVELDMINGNGLTPLMMAIKNHCSLASIKELMEAGSNVNYITYLGKHVIHYVFDEIIANPTYYTPKLIEIFIEAGADINKLNQSNESPLMRVMNKINNSKYFQDIALLLINANAEINFKIADETLLHLAVKNNCEILVKALLEHHIMINAIDSNGDTPLHVAVNNNQIELVKLLLSYNANTLMLNKNNKTSLILAIDKSFSEITKLIFEKYEQDSKDNRNANKSTTDQVTEIDEVVIENNTNRLFEIAKKNEELLNTTDDCGNTIMHIMVNEGNVNFIKILLQQKANNINAQNDHQDSPLHLAVVKGRADIVKLLLNSEANINSINLDGFSPLDLASITDNLVISNLLQNYQQEHKTELLLNGLNQLDLININDNLVISDLPQNYQQQYDEVSCETELLG